MITFERFLLFHIFLKFNEGWRSYSYFLYIRWSSARLVQRLSLQKMESVTRIQILDKAVYFSIHAISK